MGQITAKMNTLIEKELRETLSNYAKFRSELAKTAEKTEPMEDVPTEEHLWENKIRRLKSLIYGKEIVNPVKQDEVVELGSVILLSFLSNNREEQVILDGAGFKRDTLKVISVDSPIGQKLLGKKRQDKICHQQTEIIVKDIFYPW